ncbi:MAG TPA: class I SAM-dependent methyltransferase, partial [Fimbriimonas sp.]|nr:class I SAM-dependent methyltransferase [Fimbriimonas sp.]
MAHPSGDFDYETHGSGYAYVRQTDERIASLIQQEIGSSQRIINVGAGAGSYEPLDRIVVAIEPSAQMRSQRPRALSPAIACSAEELPFDDKVFDAAMATVTIHQWADLKRGLQEMRRVTEGVIVLLTFDPIRVPDFWITDYAPELTATESKRFPTIDLISECLGGTTNCKSVPIPFDCVDGFTEAFYGRPELLLDPKVRSAQSSWKKAPEGTEELFEHNLTRALKTGEWDSKFGHLRSQET